MRSFRFPCCLAAVLVPAMAHAQEQKQGGEPKNVPEDVKSVPDDLDRLVFDTGRIKTKKPEQDKLTIEVHGELQLRGQAQNPFPMDVSAGTLDTHPVSYTHLRAHETPEHLVCRL